MNKAMLNVMTVCLILAMSTEFVTAQGLQYLNQKPPGLIPEVFALGIISKENESEFGSVFNNEATEFYYGVDRKGKSEIRFTELANGIWTTPKTLLSHEKYSCNDPILSTDESRLYFISNRSLDQEHSRHRSFSNFITNLISGLIAYSFMPKKPAIKYDTVPTDQIALF